MTVIGVLGGAGTVGRVAVDRLAGYGLGELRIGGRDMDRVTAVCRATPGVAVPVRVDLHDPRRLRDFCAGCQVVVNCAGPSYQVLDTVARVAVASGADYVDAAGDLAAIDALESAAPPELGERAAVFSAGLMPGLSGLLPRVLATRPLARLDGYVGGAAHISELSAVDALLTRGPRFGTALAAWQNGRIALGALAPLHDVTLPGFRGRVHAWPFLSAEFARLATELNVGEARNYTVYVTDAIPRALATAWADDGPIEHHVPAVVAAAEADIAATGPYYTLLFQAVPALGESTAPRRLLLRTPDSYALSGVVAAIATSEVLGGRVKPGARSAAECLDAAGVFARLSGDPLVTHAEIR
ncbi:saccharopine dehydrogenase NADP-binding domain-containing protein [Nonomuraea sp. K274]|uniref:Saccharopine dehydrogenase NADP-binding domain-containing protein n=1 Tax=Nonomuraea cypriaca TaxID=1187855 RepID=A0A931AB55_9ACTN|nr:saccharopine dehydrogenase NADP-binding domain-containing protein [Nonomuraea cypriaca]MBF8186869.1 saccharopine dehydrogenase NADP-binding domain-containing protein [Nonomuraea cypriaca]